MDYVKILLDMHQSLNLQLVNIVQSISLSWPRRGGDSAVGDMELGLTTVGCIEEVSSEGWPEGCPDMLGVSLGWEVGPGEKEEFSDG